MGKYVLDAKEIMCIAANIGATELYGIPDGFNGIGKAALNKEILNVQNSLEKKGYLSENFEGETKLNDSVAHIVDACAKCEKFIAVDKQIKSQQQEGIMYYFKGNDVVKAVKSNDTYTLSIFDASMIKTELRSLICQRNSSDAQSNEFIISNQVLSKAKKLKERNADEAAEKELIDCGVSKSDAHIILKGLCCEQDFYSLTLAKLSAETNNIVNVMYIISDEKSMRLDALIENEKDVIHFSTVNYEKILNEISDLVDKLEIGGEVFE